MTRKDGRRFAFTLAAAFGVVALLMSWREHELLSRGAWAVAVLLMLAGIAVPAHLGPIERSWMKFGLILSKITSPIFLGVVYFIVVTPTAYIRRALGKNAVHHRMIGNSYWKTRGEADPEIHRRSMERQF